MFPKQNKNQTPAAPAEVVTNQVDPATGAIISLKNMEPVRIPNMATVSKISTVAGENAKSVNLRDHPEFNGMNFLVVRAKFGSGVIDGRETAFVVAEGYVYPPSQKEPTEDQHVIVITGSDNVYQRIAAAFVNNAFPILGTFRYAGRARFLD